MRFNAAILAFLSLVPFAGSAQAAAEVNIIAYNVNAAAQCSQAASGALDLKQGLYHCDVALRDPAMIHQGALLVDRGIVRARLGDNHGALADYNAAIAGNPELGDAYVNRAAAYIALKRYTDAKADLARVMPSGASNMAAAYFSRATIEDDEGDANAAYRDYSQALALNPDYAAARRELARFKVTRRTAANN